MNNSIHGGVITTKIDDDTQLNSLLNNCDFEVISRGSFGYAIKATYKPPEPLEFFDFVYNSHGMKSIAIKEFAIKICVLKNEPEIDTIIGTISETEFKDEIVNQQLIYKATTAGYYSLVPYVFYSNTNFLAQTLTIGTQTKIVKAINSGNWILNEKIQIGIIVMQIPFTPMKSAFEMPYYQFQSKLCNIVKTDKPDKPSVQYQCLCIAIEHLLRFMLTSGYVHGDFHRNNMLTSTTNGNYYVNTIDIDWAEKWSFSIIDFGRARYMTNDQYASFKEKLRAFLYEKSGSTLKELTKIIFELGSLFYGKVALFTDDLIAEKQKIISTKRTLNDVYETNKEIISQLNDKNITREVINYINEYIQNTFNYTIDIEPIENRKQLRTQLNNANVDIKNNIDSINSEHDDLEIYEHIEDYPLFYKWIFECINDNIADTVHKLILSRKQRLIEIIKISKAYIATTQDKNQIVVTEIDLFEDLGSIKTDNSIMFAYGFDTMWHNTGISKVKPTENEKTEKVSPIISELESELESKIQRQINLLSENNDKLRNNNETLSRLQNELQLNQNDNILIDRINVIENDIKDLHLAITMSKNLLHIFETRLVEIKSIK